MPSVEGLQIQNTLNGSHKIDLNQTLKHETFENFTIFDASKSKILTVFGAPNLEISSDNDILEVNAASKVTKSSVAAYNVVVTSKYVMATGKNTCSISSDYKYHTRVFKNYDPSSHKWGVLAYEVGSGWNNPEGMWYSKVTDMDFCLVHGKSHDNRGVYLIPYNGTINGKKVVNGYFV